MQNEEGEGMPKKICSYWTRQMNRTDVDKRPDRPWKTEAQRNETHAKWAKEDEQDPPCGTCDTCFLND
jgi:hypothetical protein